MIRFPDIPEVENGQSLSATVLNAYQRGVRQLMGRAHEPIALQLCAGGSTYQAWWKHIHSWWLPYRATKIGYRYELDNGGVYGYTTSVELRVVKAGNEVVVHADSTDGNKTVTQDAHDIASLGLTPGQFYEWRLYIKQSSGEGSWASCRWWCLYARQDSTTGWVTPPTFTANAVSDAAHLNALRSGIMALYNNRIVVPSGMTTAPGAFHTAGSTDWLEAARFCYRYRPNGLRANVWCGMTPSPGVYWQWRLSVRKWGSTNWTVLYTQPPSTRWSNITSGGEWGTEAVADVGTQGYSLGDWLQVRYDIRASSPSNLYARSYYVNRVSNLTPTTSWAAMTDWAEGQTNAGPARLNAISANLNLLYSGAESLWGMTLATSRGGLVVDSTEATASRHSATHLHRWLHYKPLGSATPSAWFGPNMTRSFSLGNKAGWQVFDLAGSEVAPGSTYELYECECAFESDTVML